MAKKNDSTEYLKELQQYLNGLTADMKEPFRHLAEILRADAFEITLNKETGDYLIPYMMNDAVECYLRLQQARFTGEFLADEKVLSAQVAKEQDRYILVIRQESGNTFTVLFHEIEELCQRYQYHRIGHFWVKGQEHWRRLVYMVGTVYDKYQYLGSEYCNSQERKLLKMMEFAPFRYWSPIHESLDKYYTDTQEGLEIMWELAGEAGDWFYQKMVRIYGVLKCRWMSGVLSRMLLLSGRQKLYHLIEQKIEAASMEYPVRDYGEKRNLEIEEIRHRIAAVLKEKGFEGSYPVFIKNNMLKIQVVEEHPYVISDMEYEDFEFRIHLMVWDEKKLKVCCLEEIE